MNNIALSQIIISSKLFMTKKAAKEVKQEQITLIKMYRHIKSLIRAKEC